ncbi:hypothetical protein JCGZ_15748 [Jatropha curcas]|uniref:Uncharacterized protein n=1 Tax=Jatropha curcas TaxID=180498 RepID=A0A067KYR7_JATCU|nr:hypothetical protein JCGZ_15748 [Jatropha curcas]
MSGKNEGSGLGMLLGAVVGVAAIAYGIAEIVSKPSSGSSRKTMKAPGKDGRIFRDEFEKDPAAYFRNNRGK